VAQEESTKIISKLHAILDPFLLRRLKCDVEISMPAKRVFVVYASRAPPWDVWPGYVRHQELAGQATAGKDELQED
jgi:hypothetical protein